MRVATRLAAAAEENPPAGPDQVRSGRLNRVESRVPGRSYLLVTERPLWPRSSAH